METTELGISWAKRKEKLEQSECKCEEDKEVSLSNGFWICSNCDKKLSFLYPRLNETPKRFINCKLSAKTINNKYLIDTFDIEFATYKIGRDYSAAFLDEKETHPNLIPLNTHFISGNVSAYPVTLYTPIKFHNMVHTFGFYFKREFGYDFEPYPIHNMHRGITYLLVDFRNASVFGAMSMEYHAMVGYEYTLTWIYMHPMFRRKGYLTKLWKPLEKKFGDFSIWSPLSKGMESFIEKNNISKDRLEEKRIPVKLRRTRNIK